MITYTTDLIPKAEDATQLMKALAHSERLIICCLLSEGELSVSQIEAVLSIPQPRLSRELGKLRTLNILGTRRVSREVFYHLKDDRIRAIVKTLCDVMLLEPD